VNNETCLIETKTVFPANIFNKIEYRLPSKSLVQQDDKIRLYGDLVFQSHKSTQENFMAL